MIRKWNFLLTALLLAWPSVGTGAQPSLINGSFDSTLDGWTLTALNPALSATWVPEDAGGSANSGSVEIRSNMPGNGGTSIVLSQCINIEGVVFPIPVAAKARVLTEGESLVQAWINFKEHNDPDCQTFVGFDQFRLVNSNNSAWQSFSQDYAPNHNETSSVLVQLGIAKDVGTGNGGAVRFDDVVFGTALSDRIFRDGFQLP